MAEYKGSVSLISGLTQANSGTFPLIDSSAVNVTLNENGTPQSTSGKIDRLDGVLADIYSKLSSGSGSGETTLTSKLELATSLPTPEASLRGKIMLLWDSATQSDNVVVCTIKNGAYVWSSLIDGTLVDSDETEGTTLISSGSSSNNSTLLERLSAPSNVTVNGTLVSWDAVPNATSYDIYADDTLFGNVGGD